MKLNVSTMMEGFVGTEAFSVFAVVRISLLTLVLLLVATG